MSDTSYASLSGGRGASVSLEDLRVFLAVARAGSFRAAAAQLYLSQPTLSRAIARLEATLGTEVLERGARGVELTRSGQVLVTSARRLLDAADSLRHEVLRPDEQALSIGATAASARTFLAPYLSEWIPANPSVRLSAIEGNDSTLRSRLETGDCDAAITSARLPDRFAQMPLVSVPVLARIPLNHPLAEAAGPVSVIELAPETLLLNGSGFPSTDLISYAMEVAGLHPRVSFECSSGQTLAAAAEAGMGIAVFGATTDIGGTAVRSRPVHDASGTALAFDLSVVWNKRGPDTVQEFCVGLATFHRSRRPQVAADDAAVAQAGRSR